jgi:hypothetical protein
MAQNSKKERFIIIWKNKDNIPLPDSLLIRIEKNVIIFDDKSHFIARLK